MGSGGYVIIYVYSGLLTILLIELAVISIKYMYLTKVSNICYKYGRFIMMDTY